MTGALTVLDDRLSGTLQLISACLLLYFPRSWSLSFIFKQLHTCVLIYFHQQRLQKSQCFCLCSSCVLKVGFLTRLLFAIF